MKAVLEHELGLRERKYWLWNREDARALFCAGGGAEESFDRLYAVLETRQEIFEQQVRAESYFRAGGTQHYLWHARVG